MAVCVDVGSGYAATATVNHRSNHDEQVARERADTQLMSIFCQEGQLSGVR
jgi:hypothetical protein